MKKIEIDPEYAEVVGCRYEVSVGGRLLQRREFCRDCGLQNDSLICESLRARRNAKLILVCILPNNIIEIDLNRMTLSLEADPEWNSARK